ncbi:hypothetical protein Bbelb_300710 [Branchiostoma belcheri]|nr:hypothetical protein Bbelb_300710 [Branchiostoma belcheri]
MFSTSAWDSLEKEENNTGRAEERSGDKAFTDGFQATVTEQCAGFVDGQQVELRTGFMDVNCVCSMSCQRYGRYILGSALWKVRGRSAEERYGRCILGSALWKVRGRALWEVYLWQRAVEGPRKSAMEGISLAARCGRSAEERYGRYILGSALWKVRGRALYGRYILGSTLWKRTYMRTHEVYSCALYVPRADVAYSASFPALRV